MESVNKQMEIQGLNMQNRNTKSVEHQKLLVTGVSGFLGSRICAYFQSGTVGVENTQIKMQMEAQTIPSERTKNDGEERAAGSYHVLSPSHTELEITDADQVMTYFRANKPDILIHCAAISDVGKCDEDVEKSYAINVTGVENLAKACRSCGTKMIFCSSDQIYFSKKSMNESDRQDWNRKNCEEGKKIPDVADIIDTVHGDEKIRKNERITLHKETDMINPCNTYGRQKLEAEERTLAVCPDAVCLRLSWMYDTMQLLEQEHGNFYGNVKSTLERGEICSFPIHDVRGITYVGSVVEQLPKVFLLPGGVYNYGAENDLCTYELVKQLFRKVGISEGCIKANEQAFLENPRNISMDISKIRAYGIAFSSTLDELLREWT